MFEGFQKSGVVLAASLLGLVAALNSAHAQSTGNPAIGTTPASVQVIVPMSIERQVDLEFGAFSIGSTLNNNDNIQIQSASDTPIYSDPTAFVPLSAIVRHRARFLVTGDPNFLVLVSPQVGTVTLTGGGGGLTLLNLLPDGAHGNPHFVSGGSEIYYVGGTLNVSNASAVTPGTYSGQFTVTAQYQ